MPAPHPPEFRRRAVDRARAPGASVAKVAKELGISESGLRRWMAQDDVTEPRGVVGFEVILGAYSPLSMAAMGPVSLSG